VCIATGIGNDAHPGNWIRILKVKKISGYCNIPLNRFSSFAITKSGYRNSVTPSKSTSAYAARVSYGSEAGPMRTMTIPKYERDDNCSVTITVQFYFVVNEGMPIKGEKSSYVLFCFVCASIHNFCAFVHLQKRIFARPLMCARKHIVVVHGMGI
jgi:hypothetical protein